MGGRHHDRRRARSGQRYTSPSRRSTLLPEGYDVYPVVDAIGGTSDEAHRAGLDRVLQAGAKPVGWVALAVELQRDWAREETVADVIEIVLTERLLKA